MNVTRRLAELLRQSAYQEIKIQVEPLVGEEFFLTVHDLEKNGFSIQRDSVDSDILEIGNMTSAELKMVLLNTKNDENIGPFDNISFGGAVLHCSLQIIDVDAVLQLENSELIEDENGAAINTEIGGQAVYTIPLGVFTIDNQPRNLDTISITALDNTVRLDKEFVSDSVFPTSLRNLVRDCLDYCGLMYVESDLSVFPNTYDILSLPQSSNIITCRQIVMWACQMVCTCGYADGEGYIRFKFYETTDNDFTISGSDRYANDSTLGEKDIVITGHQFIDGDIYYPSTIVSDYIIQTKDNALFSTLGEENKAAYANKVNSAIMGFTYREFSAGTLSFPNLFPLDRVNYIKNGETISTIITNATFTLNNDSKLSAKAKSTTEIKYAPIGGFTPNQRGIINTINKNANEAKDQSKKNATELSAQENAVLRLNETAAQSLGLYFEEVIDVNGAKTEYWFDKPTKEESQYICMQNAGGSFSTNTGWNDGHPVWTSGTDKYGNALCSLLNAIGIQAEWIRSDSITTDKLSIGLSERGTNLINDSSFESNSLFESATYDDGKLITPAHNDFWNSKAMTDSDEYDVENFDGVQVPTEGGFDGNKAIQGINLKGLIEDEINGTVVTDRWYEALETRDVIPVEIITHTLSFYYRLYKPSQLLTGTSVKFITKVQWLNTDKTPISVSKDVYVANYDSSEAWDRHYFLITPPNSAKYCRIAVGFQCPEVSVPIYDPVLGRDGYPDLIFLDLDGLMLEQGTILNSWTCSSDEVNNNGVIIDSKGLNVADGKIYVTDKLGRKVLSTDGHQILQMVGGLTTQKYNPVTGDVSAAMHINPIHIYDNLQDGDYLGMSFETFDENGKSTPLGKMGIFAHGGDGSGNYSPHPEFAKYYPLSFLSENGFEFNTARPLINDSQYVPNGTDFNGITKPGWYHCGANIETANDVNIPEHSAFSMRVERIGPIIVQIFTPLDQKKTYRRWWQSWDTTGWHTWVRWSADWSFEDAEFSGTLFANHISVTGNDGIYCLRDITCNGTIYGNIYNWSDRAKKENIKETEVNNAIDIINSLKYYDYDFKLDKRHYYAGLMADEAPECILGQDGKSINLYSYIGVCAMAIQELSVEIQKLKEENNGKNK